MVNIESGNNDTAAGANLIKLGAPMSGQLSSSLDKDFFKVSVTSETILNLAFTSPIQSNLNYFKISVFRDPNIESDKEIITGNSFDSFKFNVLPGDYYIQIVIAETFDLVINPNPLHHSGQYSLNVTSESFKNVIVENESNNTQLDASSIAIGIDIVGNIKAADDKDFYTMNLGAQSKYTFQFDAPKTSSLDYFKVSVKDVNGYVIASILSGDTNTFDFQTTVAGAYYFSVESADFLDTHQYGFKITQAVNTLIGGAIDDYLLGTTGADIITGLAGKDVLIGRDGNDKLDGGTGADSMIGGTGNDTYISDLTTDIIVENPSSGIDTLIASYSVTALVKNVENLTLTGTTKVDGLFVGKSAVGTGNTLDNYITGNELKNSLSGLAGNDTLDGGVGDDKLTGGIGNDVYLVDSAKDVVVEAANAGTDTIITKVDLAVTAANIEVITMRDGVVYVNGNTLGNLITGNDGHNNINGLAGNDSISGLAGADALNGGTGNDLLMGGSEADLFIFNTALSATTNLDTIADFEVGVDQIFLGRAVFSKLLIGDLPSDSFVSSSGMPAALDTNDHILFNTTTGNLYYDKDGSGVSAALQFAHLDGGISLTADDFMIA